jgi:hypothetical protein
MPPRRRQQQQQQQQPQQQEQQQQRRQQQPQRSRTAATQPVAARWTQPVTTARWTQPVTTAHIFRNFTELHQHELAARYRVHRPGGCDCSKMRQANLPPYQDGFTILPNNGPSRSVYQCKIVLPTGMTFVDQPLEAELLLRNKLFPPAGDATTTSIDGAIFCARCILMDEPNGFVGIASDRRSLVEYVRDLARLESGHNDDDLHHHDRAVDSVVLRRSEVLALVNARTRSKIELAKTKLLASLKWESDKLDYVVDRVEIGHHLATMLQLVGDDHDATFWFVIVQSEQRRDRTISNIWLDLPGGKRDLGETSLDCTIRENAGRIVAAGHQGMDGVDSAAPG